MARELNQNLLEKWARENPTLEIPLWLEKCEDKTGKITTRFFFIRKYFIRKYQ